MIGTTKNAQLSPRDPRDVLCQLKSCQLSATVAFLRYLHSFAHASSQEIQLSNSEHAMFLQRTDRLATFSACFIKMQKVISFSIS